MLFLWRKNCFPCTGITGERMAAALTWRWQAELTVLSSLALALWSILVWLMGSAVSSQPSWLQFLEAVPESPPLRNFLWITSCFLAFGYYHRMGKSVEITLRWVSVIREAAMVCSRSRFSLWHGTHMSPSVETMVLLWRFCLEDCYYSVLSCRSDLPSPNLSSFFRCWEDSEMTDILFALGPLGISLGWARPVSLESVFTLCPELQSFGLWFHKSMLAHLI